jgi:hypothetical protein
MNHRILRPLVLSFLVLCLVVGSSAVLLAADTASPVVGDDSDAERTVTGFTDLVAYGTAWVPQQRWRFSRWRPMGWGTEARAKAAHVGVDQWVHIPLPLVTVHDSTNMKIYSVEFCAKSSNGAQTYPVRWDVWADDGRFHSAPINWAPNNNRQCIHHVFNPTVWKESLGISVLLHFANHTDVITLYKAWVDVE